MVGFPDPCKQINHLTVVQANDNILYEESIGMIDSGEIVSLRGFVRSLYDLCWIFVSSLTH